MAAVIRRDPPGRHAIAVAAEAVATSMALAPEERSPAQRERSNRRLARCQPRHGTDRAPFPRVSKDPELEMLKKGGSRSSAASTSWDSATLLRRVAHDTSWSRWRRASPSPARSLQCPRRQGHGEVHAREILHGEPRMPCLGRVHAHRARGRVDEQIELVA
jgi:hypothetical protein